MRRCWMLLLPAIGCGEYTPVEPTDTAATACARADHVAASTATLTVTGLQLDGSGLLVGFDPNLTVDGEPAACVAPDGSAGKWFFTVDGEPFGSVLMEPVRVGNQTLATEGALVIDIFGALTPVRFEGTDFVSGAWVIDAMGPELRGSISQGNAQRDGRFLVVNLTAQAAP